MLKDPLNPTSPPATFSFSSPLYTYLLHLHISSSSFSTMLQPVSGRLSSPTLMATVLSQVTRAVTTTQATGKITVLVWTHLPATFVLAGHLLLLNVISLPWSAQRFIPGLLFFLSPLTQWWSSVLNIIYVLQTSKFLSPAQNALPNNLVVS